MKKYYPWFVFAIAASFLSYKYMLEVSPSIMVNELMGVFSLTGKQVGDFAAFYYYAYLLMQLPLGTSLDKYGPRRVLTASILFCVAGTLLFVSTESYPVALFGRFVIGFGAAAAAIGCLKVITLWFPTNRFAFMAGLMMTVGLLGAVFGQGPLSYAISVLTWRIALFYSAGIGLVLALFIYFFVKDKGPYAVPEAQQPQKASILDGLRKILGNKQTWLLSFYSGFSFAPIMVFGGLWGVPFLQADYHFTRTIAAEAVSLIFIGFMIGGPLFGLLSDRIGRRVPLLYFGNITALLLSVAIIYAPIHNMYALYGMLFSLGLFLSPFLLCFSMIKEVNPLIFAGTAYGFMNSFDAGLGGITDPIIGHILDTGWHGELIEGARIYSLHDYQVGLSVLIIYLVASVLILPFLKETYCRQLDNSCTDKSVEGEVAAA